MPSVRLEDLHKAYLSELRGRASAATVAAYRSDWKILMEYFQDDLRDLTPAKASGYVGWLAARKGVKTRGAKGHSHNGIRRRIASASSFCQWLVKRRDLKVNPFADVEKPKRPRRIPRAIPLPWAQVIEELDGVSVRDRAVFAMLRYAGLRVGDVADMDRENTSPDMLRIYEGKGGVDRVVPVDPRGYAPIAAYLAERGDAPGALFTGRLGGRLGKKGVYLIVQRLARRASLPPFHPHQLRHAFSVEFLEEGGSLNVLQDMLGHASLETTSIYTKISNATAVRAARELWARRGRDVDATINPGGGPQIGAEEISGRPAV